MLISRGLPAGAHVVLSPLEESFGLPSGGKASLRLQAYISLALVDVLVLALAFCSVAWLRSGDPFDPQLRPLLAVMPPLLVVIGLNGGAYCADVLANWQLGARRVLSALLLAGLMVLCVGFAWKISAEFSRALVIFGTAFSALLLIAGRFGVCKAFSAAFRDGPLDEVLLCDGVAPPAGRRGRVIDARLLGLRPRMDCPESMDLLGRLLSRADRVLVACAPESRVNWTSALKGVGIDVEVLLPDVEDLGVLATGRCGDALTAVVARGPLGLRQKFKKRALDLVLVAFVSPVLLPLVALVALLIKLDDGGPVFFVQKRVGQGNRQFGILKFRSMRSELSDMGGTESTRRDDHRITRVGRILRKTSIDELPQLFNVLKGDMSIVGPRPHALGSTAGDALFWAVDERYWYRHAAKPGLTGLAQVRGFRGATQTQADLINRVQADLEYLSGWTLWRDIRIMFATLRVILHSNAY